MWNYSAQYSLVWLNKESGRRVRGPRSCSFLSQHTPTYTHTHNKYTIKKKSQKATYNMQVSLSLSLSLHNLFIIRHARNIQGTCLIYHRRFYSPWSQPPQTAVVQWCSHIQYCVCTYVCCGSGAGVARAECVQEYVQYQPQPHSICEEEILINHTSAASLTFFLYLFLFVHAVLFLTAVDLVNIFSLH